MRGLKGSGVEIGRGGNPVSEPEWRRVNQANWDQRVGIHLGPRGYDLSELRAGRGQLNAIEEAELPSVVNKRILHLQCHFGADSLTLAQRGAEVVGLDVSRPAIDAARTLAIELGLADRARFVQADVYDTLQAIRVLHSFDVVFVTWGAITWLPDIKQWSEIVAAMLRSGGSLYLADGHPVAYVFDDATRSADGMPGLYAPYFLRQPVVGEDPNDYIDSEARLASSRTHNWIHPLGELVTSLIASG